MSHDSRSSTGSSVSEWIGSLKRGGDSAAAKIWHRYVEQLIRVADRRLRNLPCRAVDGEDIAQEAFDAFFRGVRAQRFSKIEDRNDLWQLLIMLADRRAIDHLRRELGPKPPDIPVPGGPAIKPRVDRTDSGSSRFENFSCPPVTPASAEELIRFIQRSFPELASNELQRVALDRASNYTVAEIAQREGIAVRNVERKLRMIRQILEQAAEDEN